MSAMPVQFHLADLFEIVARTVPDRVAIIDHEKSVSYAELDARTNRIAAGLAARGVKPGDKIGLYLANCAEYIETFLAAHKMGAVPFNVNYRYGAEELRYLFTNADAAVIVHGAEYSGIVAEIRDQIPTLKLTVAVPDENGSDFSAAGSIAFEELLSGDNGPVEHARSEDDLLLLYTGGTTGMPKGVMWTSKSFFFGCLGGGGYYHPDGIIKQPEEIAIRAEMAPQMRLYPLAPLMHAAALWAVFTSLTVGQTIVLDRMHGFDPEKIWDRVVSDHVSMVQIVGDAMAIPLLDALKANPGRWSLDNVRSFGSGGAVFSKHLKEAIKEFLPNAYITDGMGSSEGGVSGMGAVVDGAVMRLQSGPGQQVVIDNRFAQPGETGILARTGYLPLGYYNDPVKTAEVFREIDGRIWVMSGDQARLEEDGLITVFGRGNTCINTGGEKVYPEEVEEVLRTHPAVLDAVVVGIADNRWGQKVTAVVSLRDGVDAPDLEALQAHCRSTLAGYKLPRGLVVVDQVKRSPAGKQDYRWAKSVAEAAE